MKAVILNFFLRAFAKAVFWGKKVWLFGSWYGEKYSDNSRYFYEYISSNHPDIFSIWITANPTVLNYLKKKGWKCCLKNSLYARFARAVAEAIFVSMNFKDLGMSRSCESNHALKVQLWHGMPIKFIGFQEGKKFEGRQFYHDLIVATSPSTQQTLMQAFGKDSDVVRITGLPRNDVLFERFDKNSLCLKLGFEPRKRHIVYLPTFRSTGNDLETKIDELIKLKVIHALLEQHDSMLLIKTHHHTERNFKSDKTFKEGRIRFISLSETVDTSDLLMLADVLITDYSSCYIDYLLLNRPVIFYQYDFEGYKHQRNFYYPMEKICAGHRAFDLNGLASALEAILSGKDEYAHLRNDVRALMHTYVDGKSCERVYQTVCQKLIERKGS